MRSTHLPCFLALALALGGCASPPPDSLGQIGEFKLTERSGRAVTNKDLLGKVWVAAFFFTRCAGPCPQISGSMARLQQEGSDIKDLVLVSITVDPEHDTPEVLQNYADRFGADPQRWLFLTGAPEDVYKLAKESFHLGAEPNKGEARTPGNEVIHSTKLAVVDRLGRLREYYDGRQVDETGRTLQNIPKLRARLREIAREK